MVNEAWSGILFALAAGAIIGSVLVPMKYVKQWGWENIWFVFSICAYLLSPWIVAVFSIPHLGSVYAATDVRVTIITCLLGAGWGFAVVLFGLAVDWAGLSVATALLYGSSVALGSLGALFLVNRSKLFSAEGLKIVAWDLILLIGVWFCARAGREREPATTSNHDRNRLGISIALIAGVLSTLFNIVLTFGDPIRRKAMAEGAAPNLATNAIWALAVSAGSLPSIVWSFILLRRNSKWKLFRNARPVFNFGSCIGMAVLWITGTVLYGSATVRLGTLGTVIGWPVYISAVIISGIAWGWFIGEWGGASRRSLNLLWAGVAGQVIGIVLLSTAS